MCQETKSNLGPVIVLVNNAARTRFGTFSDLEVVTDEIWHEIFNTNVRGTFCCCQRAHQMKDLEEGVVFNVHSVFGYKAYANSIPHDTYKAAIQLLSCFLTLSLVMKIRINSMASGTVDTRWFQSQEEFKRISAEHTPMERIATTADIGEVIFSLVLYAGLFTGQSIAVD